MFFISLANTYCHIVIFSTQNRLLMHKQMLEIQLKFRYIQMFNSFYIIFVKIKEYDIICLNLCINYNL